MAIRPAPKHLETIGGELRIGVGERDGRRSSAWNVVANRNKRDIYISPRKAMHVFKLSLHESQKWRLAYTDNWWEEQGFPPERDRLIQRYQIPDEVSPGWRMATTILIPESSMSKRANAEAQKIQWWESPNPGWGLTFQILISTDDAPFPENIWGIGSVGSFRLAGGGRLEIVATEQDMTAEEAWFQSLRQEIFDSNHKRGLPVDDEFFSYGLAGDDRIGIKVPALVDLGNLMHLMIE